MKAVQAKLSADLALDVAAEALARAAGMIAENVRSELSISTPQDHDFPVERTGALISSIEVLATRLEAVVGSSDPTAVYQELGTRHVRPRPFLAPAAESFAEDAARMVGDAVREGIGVALTATV